MPFKKGNLQRKKKYKISRNQAWAWSTKTTYFLPLKYFRNSFLNELHCFQNKSNWKSFFPTSFESNCHQCLYF